MRPLKNAINPLTQIYLGCDGIIFCRTKKISALKSDTILRCYYYKQKSRWSAIFQKTDVHEIRLITARNFKNMPSVKPTELMCLAENKIFDFAKVISFRFYRKARSQVCRLSYSRFTSEKEGQPAAARGFSRSFQ